MVQEEAQRPEWETIPIQQEIQTQEEGYQGPVVQEEYNPQEIQAVIGGTSKNLDCARARHDQWLQSTPSQRAILEPAYTLGDRKHIPEAQNAVESFLRTELL